MNISGLLTSITVAILLVFSGSELSAQANLPTSYSFFGPVPEGWTINNAGGTYQTGSDDTPACRLDATGQFVQVFFDEEPGEVIYYLRGMTGGGAWSGTFSIQESVNGLNWSTKRTITALNHQAYTQFRDTLNLNSRYLRFFYTNKVSGSNVALDDVTITQRLPGQNAFIYVYCDDERIYSGSQIVTGNLPQVTFEIKNLGLEETLSITQATLSGEHAGQFSLSDVPVSIASGGSGYFNLLFNPSGNGSRFATINLFTNAENINPYVIQIYAIAGSFATEPSAQPAGMNFTNIKSFAYTVAFNHANPKPEHYLVLRSSGQPVAGAPADGQTYQVGDAIANAKVVYKGSENQFNPSGVVAGTDFYHSIFSFNGPDGFENYLQFNPLTATVSTPANMIGNFYQGVNSASPDFIETLQEKIRPHEAFGYGDYTAVMIDGFESRDTTDGKKVVYCVYSGYAHIYEGAFGWDGSPIGGTLSREHTFAHSWFPTHPSTQGVEYSDFFNLFPTHLQSANIPRSNHPLGVVQNISSQFLEGKLGTDSQGNLVYEPKDSHKGDAARAMFYMVLRYHNDKGIEWYLPPQQSQDLLRMWHFTDPPDKWEIARNDYIYSKQGNRNPFIDSIHYALLIDFYTMKGLNVENIARPGLKSRIFPNPVSNMLWIELEMTSTDTCKIEVLALTGSSVGSIITHLEAGSHKIPFDFSDLPKGVYLLNLKVGEYTYATRVVKI